MALGARTLFGTACPENDKMKCIVIVGATSGIGKELALLYSGEGHIVGVTGRRQTLLNGRKGAFPRQIKSSCFDGRSAKNKNASPKKAARQMKKLSEKKREAYITRRWWLVAQGKKGLPFAFLRRLS